MEMVKQDNRRELSAKVSHDCTWDFLLSHHAVIAKVTLQGNILL